MIFSDPVLYNEGHLVHKAIKQLLPQQKRVFQLSRVEGLTHAQIASTFQYLTVNCQRTYGYRASIDKKLPKCT